MATFRAHLRSSSSVEWLQCEHCHADVVCSSCHKRQNTSASQVSNDPLVNTFTADEVQSINRAERTVHVAKSIAEAAKMPTVAMLKRSSGGEHLTLKSVGNLVVTQHHTTIVVNDNRDVTTTARASVVTDLQQLETASDDVFVLNVDWSRSDRQAAAVLLAEPQAQEDKDKEDKEKYTFILQLISKRTDSLFKEIMARLQDENLPEDLVKRLFTEFKLRLLGLTKKLEVLLEVDPADRGKVIELEQHVTDVLADMLVPPGQREEVTWSRFSNQPVQCTDQRHSHIPASTLSESDANRAQGVPGCDASRAQGAAGLGYTPLHAACQYGDLQGAKALLSQGADSGAKTEDGLTPFHAACKAGHLQLMTLLADNNADFSEESCYRGRTPFQLALGSGKEGVLKWFLDRGFHRTHTDLNAALHVACENGDVEAVRSLLDRGASINATIDEWRHTPLHVACEHGSLDVVNTLLDKGADPQAKTRRGSTPIMIASECDHKELIPVIRKAYPKP